MAKKCKNKEDVIKRFIALERLGRIKNVKFYLPAPELFGSKTKKIGILTIDDIVEGL